MPMPTVLDISRPLTPATPPFPGDPPLTVGEVAGYAAHGARTSSLALCAHSGTHLDVPAHLFPGGKTLDAYPAGRFLLPARVVDAGRAGRVDADLAAAACPAPGMAALFKTRNSATRDLDPARGFAALTPAAAEALVRAGCALAGLDGPSADPLEAADLPAHRILLAAGALILENLDLSAAEPGDWTLACFPLSIPGLEASPVRAVLWR
ncbi:MAG: cyclase family protein [Thermodesulfobacteriota bacterium]